MGEQATITRCPSFAGLCAWMDEESGTAAYTADPPRRGVLQWSHISGMFPPSTGSSRYVTFFFVPPPAAEWLVDLARVGPQRWRLVRWSAREQMPHRPGRPGLIGARRSPAIWPPFTAGAQLCVTSRSARCRGQVFVSDDYGH